MSRYVPVLRDYLEDLCTGDLSTSDVPFCGDAPKGGGASKDTAPKAKSLKTQSRKKQSKGKEKGDGVRFLFFFCLSHSHSSVCLFGLPRVSQEVPE